MTSRPAGSLRTIADSTLFIFASRAMAVFGPPLAIWVVSQAWDSFAKLESKVDRIQSEVVDLKARVEYGARQELTQHGFRLDRLEERVYRSQQP